MKTILECILASDVLNSNLAGENRKNSNHNRNEHIGTIVKRREERSPIIHNPRYKIFLLKVELAAH